MLSKLSIGSAQFGMKYGLNNCEGEVNQSEVNHILDLAIKSGITSIDTARAYGNSEKKLGNYLQNSKGQWDVITKISDLNISIENQIIDSTNNLGQKPTTVLAHSYDLWVNDIFQDQINEIKEKNSIEKIGLSLYHNEEIEEVLKNFKNVDVIQLPINILDTRLIKNGIIKRIYENDIEIHARSIFLQGMFFLSQEEIKKKFDDVYEAINFLKKIIKDQNINLAEYSLLFVLNLRYISKVIIGIDSKMQLKENIFTINKTIDPEIFKTALSLNYDNEYILNPSKWL